ncbi:hypothetical protein F0562_013430 [Nyssa sinensis]|uniref:Putative plant transposon protein domain-containing protein n=1 Tax=Nyssa sinensis TaxID=561372 RepID=A0A5J4ZMY2_9ASTE|nr:hypothetical protein F0562_013430 [Nyssa sinensis]
MAPCRHLATADQFLFSISLVPCPRNPPLYSLIDETLVREFYMDLETVRDQVTARAFVRGISFDLMPILIVETLGISREDQLGFPYAVGVSPREEDIFKALYHDRSDVFCVIGARLSQGLFFDNYRFLNLAVSYDLSLVSHTNTLTRSYYTLLYAVATKVPINGAYVIFSAIDGAASGRHTTVLPFGTVIVKIYVA